MKAIPTEAPSAPPPRGPSLDTKGPVDVSCLARSRGHGPGAAGKARQRPGGAGSAAAAWIRLLLCVSTLCALGGCAFPEPWVKPYERERLADPIMRVSREALAAKHSEHVHEVREGARGANGVQGGGCGCN